MSRSEKLAPGKARTTALVALWLVGTVLLSPLHAQTEPAGAGTEFATLTVGKTSYQAVKVRSVSSQSIIVMHSGGMASIRLRDLPADLQTRFGYNPEAEATASQPTAKPVSPKPVQPAPKKKPTPITDSKFETLLQQFGQAPEIKTSVDLRPAFNELKLGVKNQGRRPSCSIFAVVSALEFQNAQLLGHAEKFSEEYLLWATRKTLQRALPTADPYVLDRLEDKDAGFSVQEVVTALRAYGIPLQDSMPNTFGIKMEAISDPPPTLIDEARNHRHVSVHSIPGRDRTTRLANIIHALNAGVPVVIGLRWPHYSTVRAGFLSEQKPILDYAHAVTIVGYRSPTGRLEETVFAFKNSYGVDWGMGGFGEARFEYLRQHLLDAMMLEVR
jgi:hypothetical protein